MNDHQQNDNSQAKDNDMPKRSILDVVCIILIILFLQGLTFVFVGWQSQALLNITKSCF